MTLRLYTYWRSSAAYRIRIALNLKGLAYESVPLHLPRGEHNGEYRELSPQGLVPALDHDGRLVTQSFAIVDYLDAVFPDTPRLTPVEPAARARVQELALVVACEMHPLNNLRVTNFLTGELGLDSNRKMQWYRHWIAAGFSSIEALLQDPYTGTYCHGDQPGLADAFLVPQVYNARRFECPLDDYPTICRIEQSCLQLKAFADAVPEAQPDAE